MFADQATSLRQMVQEADPKAAPRRARIVAITSGKGGVGKSNVAVNLSICLAQLGRRVVLLDGDLGTANADVLCNLNPGRNLAHVVAGRRTLVEAMVAAPGGFKLIPGASGLANMAALSEFERARLVQQMQQIEDDTDVILVDTGAGVNPNVLCFAAGADQQLVVTTPEPTAIADAYAVIKTLCRRTDGAQVSILVNMVQDQTEGRAVFARIAKVCRHFLNVSPRYAGHLPTDARVAVAVRRRAPFVLDSPRGEASVCLRQLAYRMDRDAAPPRDQGLLGRMAMWLAG